MNTTPIIPPTHGQHNAPPPPVAQHTLRYHRIQPIVFVHDNLVYAADGVVEIDGVVAWLGQTCTDVDTGAFHVAAFVDRGGQGWHAPPGWQADTLQQYGQQQAAA